jgi:hypothetical protein
MCWRDAYRKPTSYRGPSPRRMLEGKFQEVMGQPEDKLRLSSSNQRLIPNHIDYHKSSDPVVRKLGRAIKLVHDRDTRYYDIEGCLDDAVRRHIVSIDWRRMPEETYTYLLKNSPRKIVDDMASSIYESIKETRRKYDLATTSSLSL